MTFVVKSDLSISDIKNRIENHARKIYSVDRVVEEYMACIEEIINIPKLMECLKTVIENNQIADVFREIIIQSEVEFNFTIADNE